MKRICQLLVISILSLCLPDTSAAHSFDLQKNQVVTLEQIIADLSGVQAVFVGETHDQQPHHDAQLQIVRELHDTGVEVAIGLEMFRRDGQTDLDRWVAGEIDEAEFEDIFSQHWSDWLLYRDIFVYARNNEIPMLGLNIERDIVNQVAQNGFSSLSEPQREILPLAACRVSDTYRDFIRRALNGHSHDGSEFEHFCEAQILWDASMAANLGAYLKQSPQQTVVVLAGNGHSWKHGIPEQLARFGDYTSRVLLPEVPGRIDRHHSSADEADYLLQGVEMGPLH